MPESRTGEVVTEAGDIIGSHGNADWQNPGAMREHVTGRIGISTF